MAGTPLFNQMSALLAYANDITGADDTRLGDAIRSLADGYGQGGYVSPYFSEYDFTQGLNDLARPGVVATPFGGSYSWAIESNGLSIKSNTTIVDLHIPVSAGLTVEIDVASNPVQSGTSHCRLICWAANNTAVPDCGFIRRSNNYWAIYTTSGGWTFESTSNTTRLDGKTVKIVFRESINSGFIAADVYIDGVKVATNEKVSMAHTNLYLCSGGYGTVATISKIKAYN